MIRCHTLLLLRGVVVLLCLVSAIAQATTPLRQAILVQNSGWMEPFYEDTDSPFKPLVAQLATAAGGNDEVVIGLFNQADASHASPQWVYRGPAGHPSLNQAANQAQLARKSSGAYADTDFKEALLGAIEVGLEGRSGIIWIITNNKNSPNNSAEVSTRNREFYELLHDEAAITRIAAFPLKMPVRGKHYQANGLMLYALAYGEPASAALQQILERPQLKALLPEGHVRLKPLTEAAVRFTPTSVKDSPGIGAGLSEDRSTLILSFDAGNTVRTAQIQGEFENLLNPYQIQHARTSLVTPATSGLQGVLSSQTLQSLEPGQKSDGLTLSLSLPPLPSQWSREVLLRSGYQRQAAIDIRLDEQQLRISPAFIAHMAELFPDDPLPDVFIPPVNITSSVTRIPLLMKVQYPVWPAVLVYGSALALLIGALLGIALLGGARPCTLLVDGQPRQYRLKPFSRIQVMDDNGDHIATLNRRVVGARLQWVRPEAHVRLK